MARSTGSEDLDKLEQALAEAKKDMVFLISFFRMPQPFQILMKSQFSYPSPGYKGVVDSVVKIRGRKHKLAIATMSDVSAEGFLQLSTLAYLKLRA